MELNKYDNLSDKVLNINPYIQGMNNVISAVSGINTTTITNLPPYYNYPGTVYYEGYITNEKIKPFLVYKNDELECGSFSINDNICKMSVYIKECCIEKESIINIAKSFNKLFIEYKLSGDRSSFDVIDLETLSFDFQIGNYGLRMKIDLTFNILGSKLYPNTNIKALMRTIKINELD
jgi:hypothetical protein